MDFEITHAKDDEGITATYPVMHQLRPKIGADEYLALMKVMFAEERIKLAYLRHEGEVVCVACYRFVRSLGWGKYLYVDDLVTNDSSRSRGFGKSMFEWLTREAVANGCDQIRLDSALFRHAAHRFYLRERMDINCFHFCLMLSARIPDDVQL